MSEGTVAGTGRRFPGAVFGVGSEPDARFSLANERTFLAWIRTSLALVAGGVALETLGLDLQPGLRLAASIVLIVAGTLLPLVAWAWWMRIERALRSGSPLPATIVGVVLALVVSVVGVLVLLGVLLR
ncbi:YidH family protein [Promicromonospora kroppenstedtii]|uniref:YidH family protein n=1 Tax=Promicromonospora kroppenstedtii TaxID=440482 RepID=A0ABW7XPD9_9MICO